MNVERLIMMVGRLLLRKGMRAASARTKADMTPEERARDRAARQQAKRAKQAMRVGRRIGKL